MADVKFWGDEADRGWSVTTGLHRSPTHIMKMLKSGEQKTWPTLVHMFNAQGLNHIEFDYHYTLFMRGKTEDIVDVLDKDRAKGILYLAIINDNFLGIRYFRQKVGMDQMSVVGFGSRHYWVTAAYKTSHEAAKGEGWAQLYLTESDVSETLSSPIVFCGSALVTLIYDVEKTLKVKPWF